MSNLNRIKVKADWKSLLVLWVLTWVVSWVAGALLVEGNLPAWTSIPLGLVADISYYGFVATSLVLGGYLIFIFVRWLLPNLGGLVKVEIEPGKSSTVGLPDETPTVRDLVAAVGRRLDTIEAKQGDAARELIDVNQLAGTLVNLVASVMRKRRDMIVEAAALEEALRALSGDDAIAIAKAAGKVPDDLIRKLMLEVNQDKDAEYRLRLAEVVATHEGDLEACADQLKRLALDWMSKVSEYRSRAERMRTAISVIDAVRPLALLDARLQMAQYHLSLADESDAARLLRHSPAALIEQ